MKTYLKMLLICAVLATVSGCGSTEGNLLAGGVVGGVLSNTLSGAEADLAAAKEKAIAEQKAAITKLETATDAVERQALEATVVAQAKKIETITATQTTVGIAKEAAKTNWTDPNEVAPWLLSAVATALFGLTKRKELTADKLLTAYKDGVEKFKAQAQPETAAKIYADISERKKIEGV